MNTFWTNITNLTAILDEHAIPYQYIGGTALHLQGIGEVSDIQVEIQWDLHEKAYELFTPYGPGEIRKTNREGSFAFMMEGLSVAISWTYQTALRTDPYRIEMEVDGLKLWCQSLYGIREEERYTAQVDDFLLEEQKRMTMQNQAAWNQNNYQALINRYGTPEQVARKIQSYPEGRLGPLYPFLDPLKGKSIAHLMGSNGIKGVAMSLLGADVTVVDFSQENAAFAKEVAAASDVPLTYEVADVLSLETKTNYKGQFDYVVMELGVLHYFIDLKPLFRVIHQLLQPGGTFILQEFHPVSTKLITSKGKKHKVDGNYFDPTIKGRQVAYSKYAQDRNDTTEEVLQRKWTLGEVVTAVAQQGLVLELLKEEPNQKIHDIGLPKTFTLVARKSE
ncbi:class I SAM-dependent methyltransferase [Pseudalkalibacillus sp. SCS-8]|uniref:class I SAM-dependent methyltransferase n=1 Tax=Pseudalkalibacillus nanhaiensis TaxID=3115291 RepID=UPI0032DACD66